MTVHTLYILTIVLLVLAAIWLVLRTLQKIQKQHGEVLKKRKKHGAIPSKLRTKPIQTQQLQRMESHISITRRTLLILFLVSGVCLAAVPYLTSIAPTVLPIIIAAVSVILGVAAKPIIENITCGLVLSFGKLARIGDTVLVDDQYGVIEDLTLTHCVVRRWDSLRYVVPNSSMMTKEFVNYSLNDNYRWVHVEFWVDYSTNLKLVEQLAIEAPLESPYYSDRDKPRFWIADTERDAVKCMIVAWATWPSDGWALSLDIRKALINKLQEHNITTHTHRVHMESHPPKKDPAG